MKPLHHHVQRLAARMMQAENATTFEEAQKVTEKAEKHQRKISILHKLLEPLERQIRN
jgi:hypothetical protein